MEALVDEGSVSEACELSGLVSVISEYTGLRGVICYN